MNSGSSKALESYPALGLLAVTRAALGCGIGMMVAGKFQRPVIRQTTAIALLSVGVLGSVPWLVRSVIDVVNRPDSERGMKQRLASIRSSAGFRRRGGNLLIAGRWGRVRDTRKRGDDLFAVSSVLQPAGPYACCLWLARRRLRTVHWKCIAVLCGIVFLATAPWDNWAVHQGIWAFDEARVTSVSIPWRGVRWRLPAEEYAYFLIETVQVALARGFVSAQTP